MKELFFHKDGEPIFSDEIQELVNADDKNKKAALAQWKRDFEITFTTTPEGRRVLWWLMHSCHIFRSFGKQFNAGAYAIQGKHELGQDILEVIGAEGVLQSLLMVKREALKDQIELDKKEAEEAKDE